MSVGHFHYGEFDDDLKAELRRVRRNKRVRHYLTAERFRLDQTYDIPYISGISNDGRTVYIDRRFDLKHYWTLSIDHERLEKSIRSFRGCKYVEAHALASFAQHTELKRMKVDVLKFHREVNPFIRIDDLERCPADLDMTPYTDSRDEHLIATIKRSMVT